MIEPKHLRYGNVVKFENNKVPEGSTLGIVTMVSSMGIAGHSYYNENADLSCGFWQLEPIPLTDEWLEKFGLRDKEERKGEAHFHNGGLYKQKNHWTYMFEVVDFATVQYVHELQNLNFALTGEELTAKE